MDDENIPASEPEWWVPPPPVLVYYDQKPTNPMLRSCQKPAGAEDDVPTENVPKKSYCNIKITDKGKALLLEMTQNLSAEEPACKVTREVKKSPKKVIDPRTAYHEKFGRAAWTKAVKLAGQHRQRAKGVYGLAEHFTPMEWLDLCSRFKTLCPWCLEDKPLTVHHRQPLHRHGSNTIDNIWPLCWDCHQVVHEFRIRCVGPPKQENVVRPDPFFCDVPKKVFYEHGNFLSGWGYPPEVNVYSLCPSCLVENETHLDWWVTPEMYPSL